MGNMDCVMRQAFRDMSREIFNSHGDVRDEHGDVWVCTPAQLTNKETRALNYKLGISKINHIEGDYYDVLKNELFNNNIDDID